MNAILLLAGALAAPAADLPVRDYLRTAFRDERVEAHRENARVLGASPSVFPFLDDAEIRLRNEAFLPEAQRYTLRLRPKGFGETGAARSFYRSQALQWRQRGQELENRALKERYMLVLGFWELQAQQEGLRELITLQEDRIRVLEARKGMAGFELGDIIRAENELTKLSLQRLETEKETGLLAVRIRRHLGEAAFSGFDTSGVVPVDSVVSFLDREGFSVDTNNLGLANVRLEVDVARQRHRLETAESRRFISFVDFSFDYGRRTEELDRRRDGRDFDLNRAYIVEAGFRLPSFDGGGSRLRRRQADYLAETESHRKLERELQESMAKDLADIQTLIAQYRLLKARENEVDAEASLKKYQALSVDPLALLSIRESTLKNAAETRRIRFGIYRNFVRVLDMGGKLSREPRRNYLSANREDLGP